MDVITMMVQIKDEWNENSAFLQSSKKACVLFKLKGTAHLKNINNCLNTNIYSYLETSGG